ncbi:helix-turn-helix domain-containing protein [Bdellovibrio sp. SKB1291214]|uniref:helix-turn-helix domain-containing protein n=1 Tax=Bdellovibrio sp. SKB1291214 TaxID=1732569 RepID=UPI000B51B058|nr:helix-turn-helix transcriptional regulator [Bdellovibrio sp. SKB1291214]UYL10653.1 helix-turn-helix domain-containing protein [Bdellovibrio sp. SKB1291214]
MEATTRYNYYEILELPASSPQHEVTAAYERARNTYSGENPAIYTIFSEHEAREFLVLIEEAYQVLGNKILRNIYDQRLLSGMASLNDLTYASIVEASKKVAPTETAKPVEKKPANSYTKDEAMEAEIKAQENWTGEFIKKVREYKGITVERMSEITKINAWYVKAIEKTEPDNLPAIVFVRGYVVQIARALGVNDKVVADSYMKTFKKALGK